MAYNVRMALTPMTWSERELATTHAARIKQTNWKLIFKEPIGRGNAAHPQWACHVRAARWRRDSR